MEVLEARRDEVTSQASDGWRHRWWPFASAMLTRPPPRRLRDDRRHPAHIGDRVLVGLSAKLLQFSHQLHQRFLINVIRFGSPVGSIEMEFIVNDAFYHRLGMKTDKSREDLVSLFIAGLSQ